MNLFDLDGTLIDSNGVWLNIDLDFLSRRGLTPTAEYSEAVAHSIFPIAAQLTKDYYRLPESPQDIMAEWMDMAGDAYASTIPLKPGVRAFLEQTARRGEAMAVVTACVPSQCRAALAHHGLEDFFSGVVYAQELGIEKRDPRFFRQAVDLLGVTLSDCTLYEDAPGNCAAASSIGITVVGVHDDFYAHREAEMRTICHRYIKSFEELL